MSTLDKNLLLEMFRKMEEIRRMDLKIAQLVKKGKVPGMTHFSVGEEAANVGAMLALNPDDLITSNHRGHGQAIAKGIDFNGMMAEILGKYTGTCKGKGGSMHIADLDAGNLGANGIVGGGMGIAVGAALSQQMQNTGKIVVCFFGDGATNEGVFHEAVNMASIWNLPVIFYCINNGYGISADIKKMTNIEHIHQRSAAYGIPGMFIEDGNNVIDVYEGFQKAIDHVRSGNGPVLIESVTYRWLGHSSSDPGKYRTREEVELWKQKDPIENLRNYLIENNIASAEELEEIQAQVKEAVEASVKFARDKMETKTMSFRDTIILAMSEEMRRDENVFLMGEDVGVFGGDFGTSVGMLEEFGPERVRDCPISEAAISGAAAGAAMTGLRPIVDMTFMDFSVIAMDNIVNQAAKTRYMFGGKGQVPMTVRCAAGNGVGSAAQHSQSLESWFTHIPGLKVVAPGTPADMKGLLKSSIRDNNPVIILEYKSEFNQKGEVPVDPDYTIPLGVGEIKRQGTDVTVVTYGKMLRRVVQAAEELAEEGISVEIVDPRTLVPLDKDIIINSVKKTGKVVLVNDAHKTSGYIGEISAIISESEAFDYLDAPIRRCAGEDVPMPYAQNLENAMIPTVESIKDAIRKTYNKE